MSPALPNQDLTPGDPFAIHSAKFIVSYGRGLAIWTGGSAATQHKLRGVIVGCCRRASVGSPGALRGGRTDAAAATPAERPQATPGEIDAEVGRWLRRRPGDEHGDQPGPRSARIPRTASRPRCAGSPPTGCPAYPLGARGRVRGVGGARLYRRRTLLGRVRGRHRDGVDGSGGGPSRVGHVFRAVHAWGSSQRETRQQCGPREQQRQASTR